MEKQIIYLKETSSYDDILKKEHNKMPLFFKKIIFLYKNIFNIITKKKIDNNEIWILPLKERYTERKIEKILKILKNSKENTYVVSEELVTNKVQKYMKQYQIQYLTDEKAKKVLLVDTLKYIANIQKKQVEDLEITLLVNNTSNINMHLIEEIAKNVKTLKIVSLNIYKFKKIEEKLYNDYGIAIQFSNSYKKSLEKSNIIINLDFNILQINEYQIFDKAIIINCVEENIKIKSKLFNGIIINSYDIQLNKEIVQKFKQIDAYFEYKKILIYASIIEKEENIFKVFEKLKEDKIEIINLIGNSGVINKKEFKNIEKSLTKIKKQSNI